MKITGLLPWFGSKRTLAPLIVEQLGPHRAYWEPMAGSMAVLLAKEPARFETVNDLHGGLICLARVLADELAAPQLYARLARTLFSESLYHDSVEHLAAVGTEPPWWLGDHCYGEQPAARRSDANMREYAYRYFVVSWMGRNGTAGTATSTSNFCVRYSQTGGDPGVRWRAAVDSIPEWHRRLRAVVILRRDPFRLLGNIDDTADTAVYLDPPYLDKSIPYLHDFGDADHARLADGLRRFKHARIVLSYYDDPRLGELYPGWSKARHVVSKNTANANKRDKKGRTEAVEVLLVNGPLIGVPSPAGGLFGETA